MVTEGVRAATAAVNGGSPSPIDEEAIWQMNLKGMEAGPYPDHPANRDLVVIKEEENRRELLMLKKVELLRMPLDEISPSKFEADVGEGQRRKPYHHIYLPGGGFSLHELSKEMLLNRENDILYNVCGFGEDLQFCDLCPRSFHLACLCAYMLIWKFNFSPFMVLIIAIFYNGTTMTLQKKRVKPTPMPDSWRLKEIFATGFVSGS
ncbi:uncharacterized protein LOC109822796 [Asparagus officinalis]|uniref:uncharacterized protein LOC109822796 n=1 Tax=Asparagus officinalis TaxID=4686 RepID=UPI00098E67FD|nr:uncharacterized protein LOC109822796 [Asparagus officinalis]